MPALSGFVSADAAAARLGELVRARSENPPGDEAAAAAVAARLCGELGLELETVEAVPGRPNLLARWGEGRPVVAFCSHLDVVPAGDRALWEADPWAAEVRSGVLHGRGSADAKGCVAAAIEAVAALQRAGVRPRGTLVLALVADEETMGLLGAGHLISTGRLRADAAIVGEPTSLRVVVAQRGACWFRVTTRGLAAHGSAPERGRNAVLHMAEVVLRLSETLPEVSHPLLGGPSVNVGTIQGGEKVNIVPASCVAEIDRRTVPGETPGSVQESVRAAVELARARFPDLDATVELVLSGDPFETPPDSPVVRAVSEAVAAVTGGAAELIGFRGASDARFFARAGTDVVVCGPGDIALAHTARERLSLDELAAGAAVYAEAFARLLGGEPQPL